MTDKKGADSIFHIFLKSGVDDGTHGLPAACSPGHVAGGQQELRAYLLGARLIIFSLLFFLKSSYMLITENL